ncbi:hypothetical protein AURANDRAFT_67266 [Aureococcus anophagefferens]|uniref:Uncharacterized protein n=1 Tax=Aureococcus anophagefferens TaxID=44056 RepID=F0YKK8_AURAN|nr:hypothetical protein AURANDRAFT_67266 [Aureococcus anophagefferens]EGB04378.1 hypothetical protein AURANDRAFT_67266 [Aureococcus anophagefferens]|eukprot:XP_009040935.1 hypothetical protein AURANDRAFT_67266 [Aureococcus anophagefferens]
MSALVGGLSGKERAQLDAAVLEYLKKVAPAAADAFAPAPPDAAAQPGALERKWVSVVRLQRRVLDLEAKAKAGGRATPPPGGSYAPRAPCAHALRGHRGAVTCAAASGGLAATGAEDGAIRLWDCASGAAAGSLGGHVDAVLALAFDDGGALLSCSADGTAKVWPAAAVAAGGGAGATLRGHGGAVSGGCFAHGDGGADAAAVVTASRDGDVRCWRPADGAALGAARAPHGAGEALRGCAARRCARGARYGGDCAALVATCGGNTARIFALGAGGALADAAQPLAGHAHAVEAVAFGPDAATRAVDAAAYAKLSLADGAAARRSVVVATCARDGEARVWRVAPDPAAGATGLPAPACLRVLAAHGSWVRCLAWHPCGRRLSTASDDRSIKVWDVPDGRVVASLDDAHAGFVAALALCGDAKTLVSGGDDRLVRLWSCR